MSFSDFILAILVLSGAACVLWIYDINPYSTKLHIYTQTCDHMILDNTYCKGEWVDDPTSIYTINNEDNSITRSFKQQSDTLLYSDCAITNRKNWMCINDASETDITVRDGKLVLVENSDIRQITRLEWLQNKLLETVN